MMDTHANSPKRLGSLGGGGDDDDLERDEERQTARAATRRVVRKTFFVDDIVRHSWLGLLGYSDNLKSGVIKINKYWGNSNL
jgi:hypothetical protein